MKDSKSEQKGILTSPYSRRQFLVTATLAGLGALAGVGCGKGAGTSGGTGASSGSAAKDALKLGVLLPYSKVYAVLGDHITKGMELYFEGVGYTAGGRKIELLKEDDENDAQTGLRKARKFIESDKVDLLTGFVNTGIAYAVRDLLHSSKTVTLVSNAGGNDLTRKRKSPYIFRTSFTSWQPSYPMGEWVYQNVAKKVVIAAADYAFGKESAAAFKETFLKSGGQILAEVYAPLGTNDYGAYLAQIAKAKPEAIYGFFSGSDAVRFVKQFEEYGLKKDVKLTSAGFMLEEDVLPAQGKAALGAFSGLHWALTLENPENKKFVEDFKKKYNAAPSVFATQGYDTARVIVDAVNLLQGDTSNKDKLTEAIKGIKFASPRGSFEFDPETNNVVHNVYVREVKEIGGELHNQVIKTYEKVKDPGK